MPVVEINIEHDEYELVANKVVGFGVVNDILYPTVKAVVDYTVANYSALGHTHTFASLTSKPTTVSGYGITDVLAQPLTGYVSGAGTISATDTILSAIQKLNGNIGAIPPAAWGSISGTLSNQTDLQNVLNAKADSLSGTINEIAYFNSSSTISSLAVATYPSLTELSYVKGVTSAIQTQINAKQATLVSGINIRTVNGNTLLGSTDLVIDSMVYPAAGIALSTGSAWGTSITNNSANWNTAYGWGNHSGLYLPITGGTLTGHLLFTDNIYDIGASGATRPRTGYFGTSLYSPLIVGGSGTTQTLTFKTTTGVGATGADMHFLVGNNGGTEAMTILNNGFVGINTITPSVALEVKDGVISINQTTSDGYLKASNRYGQGYRITTNGASAGGSLQNYDGSSTALSWISGFLSNSTNGIASTPAFTFAGTPFAGTGTTSTPLFLMQETATTAGTTWNTGGTYLGINARSGYTGNLIDFKLNNTALLTTNYQGATTFGSYVSGFSQGTFTISHGNYRTYLETTSNNINQIVGGTYHVHSATGIYIGSSEVQPVSKLHVGSAPTASANYGLVSLGSGAFDGLTSGFFTGSNDGTVLAVNAASGFTGDLINLQVAGASKFKVSNVGVTSTGYMTLSGDNRNAVILTGGAGAGITWNNNATILSPAAGVITLGNEGITDFARLQFGGTTTSFPALKRNATGLDVRLADDSGYAPLAMSQIELGHATDTTLARSSAGNITIEGNLIYRAGGTDVPVTDGGTGVSAISALSVWVANSANTITEVTPGAGQSIRVDAGGAAWEAYTPGGSSSRSGVATKDVSDASTTQTIVHGLGRVPISVFVEGRLVYSGSSTQICTGSYDGTNHSGVCLVLTEGGGSANIDNIYSSTTQELGFTNVDTTSPFSGGNKQSGIITVDATNITITWTKSGTMASATAYILWRVY